MQTASSNLKFFFRVVGNSRNPSSVDNSSRHALMSKAGDSEALCLRVSSLAREALSHENGGAVRGCSLGDTNEVPRGKTPVLKSVLSPKQGDGAKSAESILR